MNKTVSSIDKSHRPYRWTTKSWQALVFVASFAAVLATLPSFYSVSASNPAGGSLNATATTPLTWNGTATGGLVPNAPLGLIDGEELCQEGSTCDTFTLTLAGTPADWAGKQVRLKIEWQLPATDYDMYIHKDSNSGPVVGNSGRGATTPTEPLTWEDTTIDPAVYGTGVYTIRAVYYAATSADQ